VFLELTINISYFATTKSTKSFHFDPYLKICIVFFLSFWYESNVSYAWFWLLELCVFERFNIAKIKNFYCFIKKFRLWWFILCYVGRSSWSFCAKNVDLQIQKPTSRGMVYMISTLNIGYIDVCNSKTNFKGYGFKGYGLQDIHFIPYSHNIYIYILFIYIM
jgi:hypothetical protein